nr:MAG TPA: hypothetical protein [Caudoviricetes sp.]
MQAGRHEYTYGYVASAYGSLFPNFIYHQGVTYEIISFVTKVKGGYIIGRTSLSFKDTNLPKGDRIIIEVNGTVYTLTRRRDTYYVDAIIFTSMDAYKIKILSIE